MVCSSRCACCLMLIACALALAMLTVTQVFKPPKSNILKRHPTQARLAPCNTTSEFPHRSTCLVEDKRRPPESNNFNTTLCYRQRSKCSKPKFPGSFLYGLNELKATKCDKPVRGTLCQYHETNIYTTVLIGSIAVAVACFFGICFFGSRVATVDGPNGRQIIKY